MPLAADGDAADPEPGRTLDHGRWWRMRRLAMGRDQIADDEMVLDVGPDSIKAFEAVLATTRTLVWNGPFGAFETHPFDKGTVAAAKAVAAATKAGTLLSVAGGGDTVAALAHAGVENDFTYVSTAGGAFLEWLEGKPLPGVDALQTQ